MCGRAKRLFSSEACREAREVAGREADGVRLALYRGPRGRIVAVLAAKLGKRGKGR